MDHQIYQAILDYLKSYNSTTSESGLSLIHQQLGKDQNKIISTYWRYSFPSTRFVIRKILPITLWAGPFIFLILIVFFPFSEYAEDYLIIKSFITGLTISQFSMILIISMFNVYLHYLMQKKLPFLRSVK